MWVWGRVYRVGVFGGRVWKEVEWDKEVEERGSVTDHEAAEY